MLSLTVNYDNVIVLLVWWTTTIAPYLHYNSLNIFVPYLHYMDLNEYN